MNRIVLAIAGTISLVGLVACQPAAPDGLALRYEVHAVQTKDGPTVVRFDTATGQLRQAPLAGGRRWKPIGEPGGTETVPGRYALDFVQAPSLPLTFLRLDRETGATWRLSFPQDRHWVAFRDDQASPPPSRPAERATPPAAPAAKAPEASPSPDDAHVYVEAVESTELPTEMRVWAIEQLDALGPDAAVTPLIAVLGDQDPEVLRLAIRLLAKYDDPRIVPAIEKLEDHSEPRVRRAAEVALAKQR